MALMAGVDLPLSAIREQIRRGIDLVIHQERTASGERRIVELVQLDPGIGEGYGLRDLGLL